MLGIKDGILDKTVDLVREMKSISHVYTYSEIDEVSRNLLEMTNPSLLEVVMPKRTIRDNNSLFRAASIAVFADETRHSALRQLVFREMNENPKWYDKDDPNFNYILWLLGAYRNLIIILISTLIFDQF